MSGHDTDRISCLRCWSRSLEVVGTSTAEGCCHTACLATMGDTLGSLCAVVSWHLHECGRRFFDHELFVLAATVVLCRLSPKLAVSHKRRFSNGLHVAGKGMDPKP